jgi:hypothetical protein
MPASDPQLIAMDWRYFKPGLENPNGTRGNDSCWILPASISCLKI